MWMLLVGARERCNTFCLTCDCLHVLRAAWVSLRPAASLFDRPVRRVTASTTVTAYCLTCGCILCLTTSSIRTGTWDPRLAVRSSRDTIAGSCCPSASSTFQFSDLRTASLSHPWWKICRSHYTLWSFVSSSMALVTLLTRTTRERL